MYAYLGDKAEGSLLYGLEPRDYPDDEVAALPDEIGWLVKSSRLFRHDADPPTKAEARAADRAEKAASTAPSTPASTP